MILAVVALAGPLGPASDLILEPDRLSVAYPRGFRSYALPSWRVLEEADVETLHETGSLERDQMLRIWAEHWPSAWVQRLKEFSAELSREHGRRSDIYEVRKKPFAMWPFEVVDLTNGHRRRLSRPLRVLDAAGDGRVLVREGDPTREEDRLRITRRPDLQGGSYLGLSGDRTLFARFLPTALKPASLRAGSLLVGESDGSVWLARDGRPIRCVRRRRGTVPIAMSSGASGKVLVYFAPKTKVTGRPAGASVEVYDARAGAWRVLWVRTCQEASMDERGERAVVLTQRGELLIKRLR